MSSADKKAWRRSPISPLAYSIRMEGVRQANIHASCRLDKSSRAVYEPEDVRAKRAGLVKPISSSSVASGKTRGMFKQKVMTLSATGVTKENMEVVDRVKEIVALLMQAKGRAADIGTAERRVLQPQAARRMGRMSAEMRADFDGRVKAVVERIVYSVKSKYGRRQEKLNETGVFHPDANAHRVHTQFWADLQKHVDLTKIENAVWTKMSEETEDACTTASTPKTPTAVARATTARATNVASRWKCSSKDKSRHEKIHDGLPPAVRGGNRRQGQGGRGNTNQGKHPEQTSPGSKKTSTRRESRTRASRGENEQVGAEGDQEPALFLDDGSAAPFADKFVGFPGYDELGHVPTLEEFRLEWPRLSKSRPEQVTIQEPSGGAGGGSKARRKQQQNQQTQQAQSNTGSVLNDLSKRDEVFQHFQKYYDKTDHTDGRAGNALFSAGASSTGLLQPDYDVIEAVGQHTAQALEARCQSRIGQGVLSTPDTDSRARTSNSQNDVRRSGYSGTTVTRDGTRTETRGNGHGDGLVNVFRDSINVYETTAVRSAQGTPEISAFRGGNDAGLSANKDPNGGAANCEDGELINESLGGGNGSRGGARPRAAESVVLKGSGDSRRAKSSVEGSSTSAELQARLETSWRALFVPARLKLDFLQKYSTLERALELPRMVYLLEIVGKAVPLREKVVDLLRRIEGDGEPMYADSIFSPSDEGGLYDLDCWLDFRFAAAPEVIGMYPTEDFLHDDKDVSVVTGGGSIERDMGVGGIEDGDTVGDEDEGVAAEGEVSRGRLLEQEARRQEAAGVTAWLRLVESRLVEKCAAVCDVAWYELGETITYQGRPVAHSLPHGAMEAAMRRREDLEDLAERRRRGR